MDFNYTKAEKMLQSSVREYMKKNIIPIADEYDRKGPMSKEDAVRFLKELHPFGYVGSMVPEEDGGPGLSYMEYSILGLELRKAYASLGGIVGITSAVALMVAQSDNQMIKEKCLPGLLSGDKIGATAISEPDAGSDPSDMKTTAVLKGDHYVVNGVKMWISNGSIADYIMLVCMDATNGEGRENIFRILVERDVSPFEANEIPKMGVKSFPTSELVFKDCRVPKENVLGMPVNGLEYMQKGLVSARCNAAIASVGIAEAALEAAIKYAKSRTQFGKKIGKFQMIQQLIAEMSIDVEAGRLLAIKAFKMLDEGADCTSASSIAKAFCTEMGWRVASKAIQIHGAYGISSEFPLERYFRDARCYTFPDGTTQIQHLIISRAALGMSAIR